MNALTILKELDACLDVPVELTLYGRAAIQLGYPNPPENALLSLDVDAVFWTGQAEMLNEETCFWEVVDQVNDILADRDLYISHFFTEDQVILRPQWKDCRTPIRFIFKKLNLFRLGDIDLLLSKLMRDDPQDQQDAMFIVRTAGLSRTDIENALREARKPDVPEIVDQFEKASSRLLLKL